MALRNLVKRLGCNSQNLHVFSSSSNGFQNQFRAGVEGSPQLCEFRLNPSRWFSNAAFSQLRSEYTRMKVGKFYDPTLESAGGFVRSLLPKESKAVLLAGNGITKNSGAFLSSPFNTHIRSFAKLSARGGIGSLGMKVYKPTTPGFRGRIITRRDDLWKGKPFRRLTIGKKRIDGRNNKGRKTIWWRGGGHKRLYRIIDFKRKLFGMQGVVRRLEYDPNRSGRIALIDYPDENGNVDENLTHYIIAPHGLQVGDPVTQGPDSPIKLGNALPLFSLPLGTVVHNVELIPGRGGQFARAAGTSCTLMKKDTGEGKYCTLKMTSGELRLVLGKCMASVGRVSNVMHSNRKHGKAGASRWLGRRPHVRGVAMNPIDHPMGGGEGKTSGGRPSCTPWGVPCKGYRTRRNKRTEKFRVQRRPMKNRKGC